MERGFAITPLATGPVLAGMDGCGGTASILEGGQRGLGGVKGLAVAGMSRFGFK